MKYILGLAISAKSDLREIFRYIEQHDSLESADNLVNSIEKVITSLTIMPQRGHCPPELARIGIHEFLEIHFKPYRIVYSIRNNNIVVHCVLDGRRDMQTLLQQRLLR
jgi:toxin ParE1/3/4